MNPNDRTETRVCIECKGAGGGASNELCEACDGTGQQPAQPGSGEVKRYIGRITELEPCPVQHVVLASDFDRLQSDLAAARQRIAELEVERGVLPGVYPTCDGENIWLLVYEDQDMEPVLFSGHGADEAAQKAFEHAATKWTVRLFKCVAQDGYGPGTNQRPALPDIETRIPTAAEVDERVEVKSSYDYRSGFNDCRLVFAQPTIDRLRSALAAAQKENADIDAAFDAFRELAREQQEYERAQLTAARQDAGMWEREYRIEHRRVERLTGELLAARQRIADLESDLVTERAQLIAAQRRIDELTQDAIDARRWRWARNDRTLWSGTYDYGIDLGEGADAVADAELEAIATQTLNKAEEA